MTGEASAVVLALNSGSSSLKFGLYRVAQGVCEGLITGEAEGIGQSDGRFWAKDGAGGSLADEADVCDAQGAVARVKTLLDVQGAPGPRIIGHRIVHGGAKVRRHCLIDAAVMRDLEAAAVLAPLHVPPALAIVRYAADHFGALPQVACLDTAFHADMPDVARTFAIPENLRAQGLMRYGFHGLSCESVVRQLGGDLPGRLVIAHLGGGSSVTAVRAGRSVDTSMGLTPSGGVMMATRCGDIDPGLLIYLAREKGLDADALEDLVDRRSGMLGVSGSSADIRAVRKSDDASARLAIAMFQYSVQKQIAAMMAACGGADLLVFTGGIGEHDARTRAGICQGLGWLGVGDRCPVRALPSLENQEIARHAWAQQMGCWQ
jgi:acetate kinase